MLRLAAGTLLAVLLAGPARAEVTSVGPSGFVVKHEAVVAGDAARAWARLVKPETWWSPDHTYSGDAKNLSLALTPGGCFCETLPKGGFVKHLEVAMSKPEQLLRLHGALGPLGELGVEGALSFVLAKADGGTKVTLTYQVGGFLPGGFETLAPVVDRVLGEQLRRYAAPR